MMLDLTRHQHFRWFSTLLILFIIVVVSGTAYTLQRLRTEALNKHFELAAMHARLFENYLTHTLTLIGLTLGHVTELDTQALNPKQLAKRLHNMLRYTPAIRSLSLLDSQGQIIASSNVRNLGTVPLLPHTDEWLPPASQTRTLLRSARVWEGRDFYNGRPTSNKHPAAFNEHIFLPLLLEPAKPNEPRALAAVNPDFMLNYFLANIPIEQGIVDVLRYDGSLLFSTHLQAAPGELYLLPAEIDLSNQEFGFLHKHYDQDATISAFRASRHFPLLVLVFFDQAWVLSAWQKEAKNIASIVGFSLLLLILVSLSAYHFLRKAAQREQHAQQQMSLAAKVYAESEEGIMVMDHEQKMLLINPAFTRITGYTHQDLKHISISSLFTHVGDAKCSQEMWHSLHQNGHWHGEIVNRHKNGKPIDMELKWLQLSAEQGESIRYVAIFSDITEQKCAEIQLRQLSLAIEQSPGSVVITDLNANIEYVNKNFCETTGYSYAEVIGQNPRILNSGLTSKDTYDDLWKSLSNGQAWEGDFFNRRKDGSTYIEHALIAPLFNDGHATHYVAVEYDITEIHTLTENLRQAKEAAETANHVKDAFIANISHELRTPLNAILGFAQILQESQDIPSHHQDEAARIYHSGQQLLSLVTDVLDLTKIGASQIKLFLQETHTALFFQELVDLFRIRAAAKSLQFKYHRQTPLPHSIYIDPKRLRQALNNLVMNAIKFTEQGSIKLQVAYVEQELHIHVEDTGIGIAVGHQTNIFQAFAKIQGQTYKQGSGLGLSITHKIVELMGGRIELESQLGQGSCFRLYIPITVTHHKKEPSLAATQPTLTSKSTHSNEKFVLDKSQHKKLLGFLEHGAMTELISYLEQLSETSDCPLEILELLDLAKSFQLDEIQQRLAS